MIRISFEEVFSAFQDMQKAQNEPISDHWIEHAKKSIWYKGTVNPSELIVPYPEFRRLVFYGIRGLTNKEALEKILNSNNEKAMKMITGPLKNQPPIIVWLRQDGRYQVDDGCRRSLTACYLGIDRIDAYIAIPGMPEKLDYWKIKPPYTPEDLRPKK